MKKYVLLISIPIVFLLDMWVYSLTTEGLSSKSDFGVAFGFCGLITLIGLNVKYVIYIFKTFNNKNQNNDEKNNANN